MSTTYAVVIGGHAVEYRTFDQPQIVGAAVTPFLQAAVAAAQATLDAAVAAEAAEVVTADAQAHLDAATAALTNDERLFMVPATAPAPPPIPPTPRQWLERLAPATQAAMSAVAITNPAILLWMLKAAGSSSIDVTLPETIQGVAALVAAGVLTTADQTLLLMP